MNLIRTDRTYKTSANAEAALAKTLKRAGQWGARQTELTLDNTRYLIAVAPDGRFAPVLVGAEYVAFIHCGITVVG